jgi:hypothetical protein
LQPFNQSEWNDLVLHDVGLTEEKSELLGSRLEKNLLAPEQTSTGVEIVRKSSRNSS